MIGAVQSNVNMNIDMMAQMKEKMFTKLDTDGDGQIDLSELEAQATEMGDDRFTRMLEDLKAADTDGDGMISQAEFDEMEPPPPPPPPPEDGEMSQMEDMPDFIASMYTSDGSVDASTELNGVLLDLLG